VVIGAKRLDGLGVGAACFEESVEPLLGESF
jgi:hypothetical protein